MDCIELVVRYGSDGVINAWFAMHGSIPCIGKLTRWNAAQAAVVVASHWRAIMCAVAVETNGMLAESFKHAMRAAVSSVTIITTADAGGGHHAMTATAVTSVSVAPPTLLVCVNRSASIHRHLSHSVRFCVNLLGPQHRDLAKSCGSPKGKQDRFQNDAWSVDQHGIPYLPDAQASFFCDVAHAFDVGTHTILCGIVKELKVADHVNPLFYVNGAFQSLGM